MVSSLSAVESVVRFLPIGEDVKKEIDALDKIVTAMTKTDDVERTYMILLQNNMELRPGGGFLGQYAIVKVKNGEVLSTYVEDANLLDQRIEAKIPAPYPFKKMMQTSNWKFRDSNFSPDFPTNVEKAKYFYRLSGKSTAGLDGMIAVNAMVFDHVLELTGPITVPGYPGEYTSKDGALKLEEYVEKIYIMNPEIDTQNRKAVMKDMAPIIVKKLFNIGNISKIAQLAHDEMKQRNIMINFTDPTLQKIVEDVHWDGTMASDWDGDYLMAVDANMGALKTDYWMRREFSYDIDLTLEKPRVTLGILYKNTAPFGDWRTSDYHSYLRVYVPKGSTFIESTMVSRTNTGEEFGKTFFGFLCHVLIGRETDAKIVYELPADFKKDDYKLLIQKQSGMGEVPVKIRVKTADGDFDEDQILKNDLKLQFQK